MRAIVRRTTASGTLTDFMKAPAARPCTLFLQNAAAAFRGGGDIGTDIQWNAEAMYAIVSLNSDLSDASQGRILLRKATLPRQTIAYWANVSKGTDAKPRVFGRLSMTAGLQKEVFYLGFCVCKSRLIFVWGNFLS